MKVFLVCCTPGIITLRQNQYSWLENQPFWKVFARKDVDCFHGYVSLQEMLKQWMT